MPPRYDPAVAVEIMNAKGYQPIGPYPGAMAPWPSVCTAHGHPSSPRLGNVKVGRSHCKPCSDERTSQARAVPPAEAERDLACAQLLPLEDYPGANHRPWWCLCLVCFAEVPVLLKMLRSRDSGCRECGNARKGAYRIIPTERAEVRMRESGLIPVEDYPGRIDIPWRCRCARCDGVDTYLLQYVAADRRRRPGQGCRDCRAEELSEARRRQQHDAAVRIMTSAGITPLELYPGRNARWRGRCDTCQDEVSPRLGSILQGQGGCARCGWKRGGDKRRIPDGRARAHMQRRGFDPTIPYEGFTRPWPSVCRDCKKTVSPTLADVLGGHGCLVCKGGRVDPVAAEELMLGKGFKPLTSFPGAHRRWKSLHECGTEVMPTFTRVRRTTVGTACSVCTPGGWNDDAPSLVYVIVQFEWDAGKVGVMNLGSRRVDVFRGQRWHLVGTLHADTGWEARRIEKAALDRIMGVGDDRIPPFLSREELPSGWRETFALAYTLGETALEIVRSAAREQAGDHE